MDSHPTWSISYKAIQLLPHSHVTVLHCKITACYSLLHCNFNYLYTRCKSTDLTCCQFHRACINTFLTKLSLLIKLQYSLPYNSFIFVFHCICSFCKGGSVHVYKLLQASCGGIQYLSLQHYHILCIIMWFISKHDWK